MFDFMTNIVGIFVNIYNAVTSVFEGIFLLIGWLVEAISNGFDYATKLTAMIPYQIFIIAIPCIALVVAFNVINFIKGWI